MHDTSMFPVKVKTKGKVAAGQIIVHGDYRFSILLDGVIRIEFDRSRRFVDEPTQAILHRNQGNIPYEKRLTKDVLAIETGRFVLTCHDGTSNTRSAFSIMCKQTGHVHEHGDDINMLPGTGRTLDDVSGPIPLGTGVVSRDGIAILDDGDSLLLDQNGWPYPRPRRTTDLYAFVYGHDYLGALSAYYQLSGPVPLIPRFMLGNWWSRYHPYTDRELLDVVDGFADENIPLSVAIVDMDWHITAIPGVQDYHQGWTGYTVNKTLFPKFRSFIGALHKRGVKTALNLHPAGGVKPYEQRYKAFAEAVDVDHERKETIPFDSTDPVHMKAYFQVLLEPFERMGIDFWWIDWQQGKTSKMTGLDPLWMLNHLHFHHHGRLPRKRPVTFSRWSGKGAQRYPIGFSGDAHIDWKSLHFQPFFTASAANIGFSFWSHDIGGHMAGAEEPELYVRWLQFGCFSPILRIHSTANRMSVREPWRHEEPYRSILGDFMRLRFKLIPYMYTAAYLNHARHVPMILPLYYMEPENDKAYRQPNTYLFGSELLVHPVTKPMQPSTRRVLERIYLPKGSWTNIFSGITYEGGKTHAMVFALDETGVFAKAGAIVPLDGGPYQNQTDNPRQLTILVYPGADNTYVLYEDDGKSQRYLGRDAFMTTYTLSETEDTLRFVMAPDTPRRPYIPARRQVEIVFHGIQADSDIHDIRHADIGTIVSLGTVKSTETIVIDLYEKRILDVNLPVLANIEQCLISMALNPSVKTRIYEAFEQQHSQTAIKKLLEDIGEDHRAILLAYLGMMKKR